MTAEDTANPATPNTIVLIHGLWVTPLSWEHWKDRYEVRLAGARPRKASRGGNDIILTDHVPAVQDLLSCGSGFDRAIVDRKDVVAGDCERLRTVHGSEEEVFEQEGAFFESLPPAQRKIFFTFFDEQLAPDPFE